ncbi:MAG: hypothetical protein LUE92_13630 [Clostridiales bacterium]|nr:hypothetical protein [Clostridiales bacterium]
MDKKHREWAREIFGWYGQEFEPVLLYEDDRLFVMDWKDKNGSGNLATRYIVDKEKGDLIIKGDAGCCIASWYNEVTVENMACYINSTGYFIEKMNCTDHKHTYKWDDVKKDLEDEKQEYLRLIRDGDLESIDEDELNEDFDEMQDILADLNLNDESVYPSELTDLFSKYNSDWWEGPFSYLGRRIDSRIYLWTYGFQEGVERLRGKELVRKDI